MRTFGLSLAVVLSASVFIAPAVAVATPLFADASEIPGLYAPCAAWGDYDNDNDLDYLIAGLRDLNQGIVSVYRNDGSVPFHMAYEMDLGFAGGQWTKAAWGDYDNDNDLDILSAFGTTRLWRNDGNAFNDVGASLPSVNEPALAWGDHDNDGDLDFLIAGWTQGATRITQVRRNDGGGAFADVGATLPGVTTGAADWADFDHDEDLDLLLAGTFGNGQSQLLRIYRNDGGSSYVDVAANLTGLRFASVEWGDYDADGDLDVIASGAVMSAGTYVYRNDSAFFSWAGPITPVSAGSTTWGDYDNDGDLDFLAVGQFPNGAVPRVWRNDGFGGFVVAMALPNPPQPGAAAAAWGDYDMDGDVDVLLAGGSDGHEEIKLYRNDSLTANASPSTPSGLAVATSPSSVSFSWTAASDAETPAAGLSYNLRVGTTPGGVDVVSPMSSGGGTRRLVRRGPGGGTGWQLKLPPGTYYWSVQAIDGAYAGSPFAVEQIVHLGAVDAPQLPSASADFALQAPRPNPFARNASIAFDLPRAAEVTVRVYDVSGRSVRSLSEATSLPAGRHQVEWDGLDDAGALAANGVYFVALESREFTANRRLVLVR